MIRIESSGRPTTMPFTKRYDNSANVSEGAFGQLSKFEIHPWYLLDPLKPASTSDATDLFFPEECLLTVA